MPDSPVFVVVLTGADTAFSAAPRAIGPFADYDVAQAFAQTLTEQYQREGGDLPAVHVVRVESDQPGVVLGEL